MPIAPAVKTASTRRDLFSALESVAADLQRTKIAGVAPQQPRTKVAGPTPPDPGGYAGKSSHPSANVDNNVQGSETGARASENTSDVKEDQGAPSVDSTPEATNKDGSGDQDKVQLNIGTEQSATGEDPSVEDNYKGDKDDPGTSHPAKTEDGEKYGSVKFAEAKARANSLANSILADLANGFGSQLLGGVKVAGARPTAAKPAPATPAPTQKSAQQQPSGTTPPASSGVTPGLLNKAAGAVQNPSVQAGYELATILGVEKSAAEASVAATIEATILDAHLDASLLGNYLANFEKRGQARPKHAGDDEGGEDHSTKGDSSSGAGGGTDSAAPPSGGGGAPGDGGGGESLGDMLGGGGDPGGLMSGGGGGGPPAPGGGAPGGDLGGGVSKQQALEQLVSALMELGIPIDQLAGAGGPPPGAGAPPPGVGGDLTGGAPPAPAAGGIGGGGGADPMSEGMKLASAALAFQRSGQFRFKEAADGTPERHLREEMKAYLIDLIKTAEKRQ